MTKVSDPMDLAAPRLVIAARGLEMCRRHSFDADGARTGKRQRTTPGDFLTPLMLGMAPGYHNQRRSVSQQIRVPQFAIRGDFCFIYSDVNPKDDYKVDRLPQQYVCLIIDHGDINVAPTRYATDSRLHSFD